MRPTPQVLLPWIPAEAITVKQASAIARKAPRTVRGWAARHDIGRRVVGGDWMISRPALLMLLESNDAALAAYLRGEREAEPVASYFRRAGVWITDGHAGDVGGPGRDGEVALTPLGH